jgi:hypothetical protein
MVTALTRQRVAEPMIATARSAAHACGNTAASSSRIAQRMTPQRVGRRFIFDPGRGRRRVIAPTPNMLSR